MKLSVLYEDQTPSDSGQSTNRPSKVSKGPKKGAKIGQAPEDQKGDVSKTKKGY